MKINTVEMADATHPLSEYVQHADTEPTVITVEGKPIAVVVSIEEIDWESFALSRNPQFLAIIERSRKSSKQEKGLTSDEMRACLGLTPSSEDN